MEDFWMLIAAIEFAILCGIYIYHTIKSIGKKIDDVAECMAKEDIKRIKELHLLN